MVIGQSNTKLAATGIRQASNRPSTSINNQSSNVSRTDHVSGPRDNLYIYWVTAGGYRLRDREQHIYNGRLPSS